MSSISREELEQMALEAVSAEDYYDLLDTLEETPDEDLWRVINEQDEQPPVVAPQKGSPSP